MTGIKRRVCEANCDEPATHRLENRGGEHFFVCEMCSTSFEGDVSVLAEGRRYVYTEAEQ